VRGDEGNDVVLSGEGACLTNIDFVPSTKRPPRGGPLSWPEDVNVAEEAEVGAMGEDGPAPGDCGSNGLLEPLAEDAMPDVGGGMGDCGCDIPEEVIEGEAGLRGSTEFRSATRGGGGLVKSSSGGT
jgi:hypothetical protein